MPSPEEVKSVIVLVHGIRTNAPWIAMLRAQLESAEIVVEPTNYGRFDALRFLWGSRRKPIDEVWTSVKDVRQLYPNAKISFLAHSFGTYIVSQLLQREFDFVAHRIVFCGSVVQYGFPFSQVSNRFKPPLLNETSARDPWPVLGEKSSWGYGSAGTFGFKVPRVRDRWHRGSRSSGTVRSSKVTSLPTIHHRGFDFSRYCL
jgi:pimeloyl-ACP methyl ester carboxylesterase